MVQICGVPVVSSGVFVMVRSLNEEKCLVVREVRWVIIGGQTAVI